MILWQLGFGETLEQATHNHDDHLEAFLQRCDEKNLKLNDTKFKLRMQEVPFIGHIATANGLCVDPHKVQAIMEMPQPDDVAAIQRLLGLAQYLSKFLPHLSDITKPLRELTQKDTEWTWGPAQQNALETLKKAVSSTPVLRYYNLQEEVTLQCDALNLVWGQLCCKMASLLRMHQEHSHQPKPDMLKLKKNCWPSCLRVSILNPTSMGGTAYTLKQTISHWYRSY